MADESGQESAQPKSSPAVAPSLELKKEVISKPGEPKITRTTLSEVPVKIKTGAKPAETGYIVDDHGEVHTDPDKARQAQKASQETKTKI